MKSAAALIILLGICYAAAGLGALWTRPVVDSSWYRDLRKPPWNPPSWVFGPVWTALYTAMALAAWLVWREDPGATLPMLVFAVQLGFNVIWSLLFFRLRSPGWALLDIVALWLSIAANLVAFFPVSATAGWLMVPYILWVSFAGLLNGWIWRHNHASSDPGKAVDNLGQSPGGIVAIRKHR